MTFHDDVASNADLTAIKSIYNLQILINTILPVDHVTQFDVNTALETLANELDYKLKYDDQIGVNLVVISNEKNNEEQNDK